MNNKKIYFILIGIVIVFLVGAVIFFIQKYEKVPLVTAPQQKPEVTAPAVQPVPAGEPHASGADDQFPTEKGKFLQ